METPNDSAPNPQELPADQLPYGDGPWPPQQIPASTDPNNPPWGLATGILVWLASVVLTFGMGFIFLLPYAMPRAARMTSDELTQFLSNDPTALILAVVSAIPAHLITLGIVWAVVSYFGRRPFWKTIGWSRGKGFGLWISAGAAALLYVASIGMIYVFGQSEVETSLSRVVASSRFAALSVAFLAVVTAPFVEELVYRGVLYSGLQKVAGRTIAVIGVLVLFTIVHVPQYWPNYGVIAAIGLLSVSLTLVRAYTGRLLPCYIMHLVFNGIQGVIIIFEPLLRQIFTKSEQTALTLPIELFRAIF